MKKVVLIIAALAMIGFAAASPSAAASSSSNDISNIKIVISASNDPKMNVQDLAFFLATHNYDTTPKEGYVELDLNGHVYKVTPNGDNPEILEE